MSTVTIIEFAIKFSLTCQIQKHEMKLKRKAPSWISMITVVKITQDGEEESI